MSFLETLKSKPVVQTNKYIKIKMQDCNEETKEDGKKNNYIVNESKNLIDLDKEDQQFIDKVKQMNQLKYRKQTALNQLQQQKMEDIEEKTKTEEEIEGEEIKEEENVPDETRVEIEQVEKPQKKEKRKTVKRILDVEKEDADLLELKKKREARRTKKIKLRIQNEYDEKEKDSKILEEKDVEYMEIGEEIKLNIPEREIIKIPVNSYYLNNRNNFTTFINNMFDRNNYDFDQEKGNISCEKDASKPFGLLSHQKIVRDYLNIYSPYRGLLLYHGLGAGKTCGSIGIAEGLKSEYEIIVLTPASLKTNYIKELKKCGDPLYKTNNYWIFKELKTDVEIIAYHRILGVSKKFIKTNGGVYVVDNEKTETNYDSMSDEKKFILNEQINQMIKHKYKFYSYNGGLRTDVLEGMEDVAMRETGQKNPFSHKVVIIDEVHNFISRIVNKLKQPNSLSYRLYEHLMSAVNCRLVFLSGTPIINYPNEIGVLFNMLRGYMNVYTIPINTSNASVSIKNIPSIVENFRIKDVKMADRVVYKGGKLIITMNPMRFSSVYKRTGYDGVSIKNTSITDKTYLNKLIFFLEGPKYNISVSEKANGNKNIQLSRYKALPDDLDEFMNKFIDRSSMEFTEPLLFRKRIIGLASYFRSAAEKLLPKFDPEDDVEYVKIDMSDHQLEIYESARVAEREQVKRDIKKAKKGQTGKDGIYNQTSSTYRIYSRLFCNFVFPKEMIRPLPQGDAIITENTNINIREQDVDLISIEEQIKNDDGDVSIDDKEDMIKQKNDSTSTDYASRIQKAIERLKSDYPNYLKVNKDLKICSPKFVEIFKRISNPENVGCHLLYSQFRTLEGIELFKTVLEFNGYEQFKLKKDSNGWDIVNVDLDKPKFLLYTGTEDSEEKELLRNIFNNQWELIKETRVKKRLEEFDSMRKQQSAKRNMFGEICKIFMITSSGAEGIDLKNVRFVHIMEPYWHPVRSTQIIGRAVRICSHFELPEDFRDVKVFYYIMQFSDIQRNGDPNGKTDKERETKLSPECNKWDVSKDPKNRRVITTDESLHEISEIKKRINKSILHLIKEASIDCQVHVKHSDNNEVLQCYNYRATDANETFTFNPNIDDDYTDAVSKKHKRKKERKFRTITLRNKKYIMVENPILKKMKKIGKASKNQLDADLYIQGNPLIYYNSIKSDKEGKVRKFVRDPKKRFKI